MTQPRSSLAAVRDRHMARAAAQYGVVSGQALVVAAGVLLALGLRTIVYEPFNIPSASMQPALLAGDYLFVAKWPYGYSRYAVPLGLPLFGGRLLDRMPERGDVVVFKSPRDNRTDFIKRVIGLPGDRVRLVDGRVELNGAPLPVTRLADFSGGIARYRETLPSGRSFAVLDAVAHGARDDTAAVTVPAGHYFVLGDNRDDSADSRLSIAEGGVGMVPAENLVGRADRIFFSVDERARWRQPGSWWPALRFDRIGSAL